MGLLLHFLYFVPIVLEYQLKNIEKRGYGELSSVSKCVQRSSGDLTTGLS